MRCDLELERVSGHDTMQLIRMEFSLAHLYAAVNLRVFSLSRVCQVADDFHTQIFSFFTFHALS